MDYLGKRREVQILAMASRVVQLLLNCLGEVQFLRC